MKASNQSTLKFNNQRVILDYIIKNGATSRAELAKNLGVSKPTISTNVNYLIENRVLLEEGFYAPIVGKKGVLLHFNKNRNYIVVCDFISDIENKNTVISVCNLNYEEIITCRLNISLDLSFENLNYIINCKLIGTLATNNIPLDIIASVIISAPGVVADHGLAFKIETGDIFDISEICNKHFKDKVILKNDIKLATIAENHIGLGSNYENLAFIWSGVALNSGLIINNKIYDGTNYSAGEIGLLLANSPFTSEPCFLGEIASINGLLCNLNKFSEIPKDSILFLKASRHTLNFDDVINAVNSCDVFCLNLIKSIGKEFGKALYNLSLTLDLEALILSGDFFKLGDVLINEINSVLLLNPLNNIKIELSEIRHGIILGGYTIGVEHAINNLI